MRRKAEYRVTFDLPEGATLADGKLYVLDAVSSLRGSLQPPGYGPGGPDDAEEGDPMHGLDPDTVRVARITRTLKK